MYMASQSIEQTCWSILKICSVLHGGQKESFFKIAFFYLYGLLSKNCLKQTTVLKIQSWQRPYFGSKILTFWGFES